MEDNPRSYIEHDPTAPVEVDGSPYYRRRIAQGELLRLDAMPGSTPANAKPAAKATKKGAAA